MNEMYENNKNNENVKKTCKLLKSKKLIKNHC